MFLEIDLVIKLMTVSPIQERLSKLCNGHYGREDGCDGRQARDQSAENRLLVERAGIEDGAKPKAILSICAPRTGR